MKYQKQVVMIGPSLTEKGGMGSVQKLIVNTCSNQVQIKHISTWDGEPGKTSTLDKIKVFTVALFTLLGYLLQGKVDLVHLHISERGSVVRKCIIALICMVAGKPFILHAHGCEFHIFYDNLPRPIQQLITLIFRQSAELIALSESWRKYYVETCGLKPEQVRVLNNPVELPNLSNKASESQQLKFVFLGKINQRKGIYDLIKAVANLEPQHRQAIKLILAGSGEVEQAQKLATDLGIIEQISFPGWINDQQRNQLLAESDVFVLPSYNEGLPMAILEGMSWGLPIITTPVGGIPEVILDKETGLLVTPGDIEQLTQAIQSLIEQPSLRQHLGQSARKQVEPLSLDRYNHALSNIYNNAFKPNPILSIDRYALKSD